MLYEGDDPYQLLGVERGVDPRNLKQAYSRLIREYRPDRAPTEFARIHAAFERVQATEAGAPAAPLPPVIERASDVGETPAEPPPETLPQRIHRLFEARAYDDLVAVLADRHVIDDALERPEVARLVLLAIGVRGTFA